MALEEYMLSCPTKKFLGIDCLGCGTQRAIVLVFEGKFVEAFQMFPAVYFMLSFLFFAALNFIDRKRNYAIFLIVFGALTAVTMVVSYTFKHILN